MFFLTIAKINETIFSGMVNSVNCPGSEGEMTILPNHIPLITTLKKGEVRIKLNDEKIEKFNIEKGILEVSKKEVIILL
ncbi:MAG: ATP synthase F1 subunit epsilon [Patescibacteria group bacterium]